MGAAYWVDGKKNKKKRKKRKRKDIEARKDKKDIYY